MENNGPASLLIIRLVPGITFLLEGIQKFLYADTLGVGRFTTLGIHPAAFWAPFTGVFEIVCGLLLLLGLLTRLATLPLLIVMVVAFISTKRPTLLNKGFFPMFHDYRADYAMTLTLICLLITGAGTYSVDHIVREHKKKGLSG